MAKPVIYSQVGPNLSRLVDDLAQSSEVFSKVLSDGQPSRWEHPSAWEGDPLVDIEAPMKEAFKRDEENEIFKKAVLGDPPGQGPDIGLTQQQVDWIAIHERAFRRRHLSWTRAVAQESSRKLAASADHGPLKRGVRVTMQDIIAIAQQKAAASGAT